MSSHPANGREEPPIDDEQPSTTASDAVGEGGLWGDGFTDPFGDTSNVFSAEIENVSASDWDVDADQIWGDDGGSAFVDGGGLDFPM